MSFSSDERPRMSPNPDHLVWIDMEMSGLDPERERILEIALVVTDKDLNLVEAAPVLVVHQPDSVLDAMDAWNKSMHGKSGLIDKVRASTLTEAAAETQLIEFMRRHVPQGASPMCGNSICQDRRFLARYMPRLEAWFHYRNLDVSTLKELAIRWRPGLKEGFPKAHAHTAMADVLEAIAELKYYREHFLRLADPA